MSRAVFSTYRPGLMILLGLAAMLTLAGTAGGSAGPCESAGVTAEGDEIDLLVTGDDGDEVAEILVNDEVVVRIRAPLGGWSAAERGAIVLNRLRILGEDHEALQDLMPGERGNYSVVASGDDIVVTADARTADANETTPGGLAGVWCNNIREAFGIPRLQYEKTPKLISMVASWYGEKFTGLRTASGEVFDPTQLTAAHPYLPFGTIVQVTYPPTGKTVMVRINDRGPFTPGRDLDLSREAARRLGLLPHGVDCVEVAILRGEAVSLD
ncbi:MAG: septal ring lytic transglycosylase RlpA family protein [Bacillota bacterium]